MEKNQFFIVENITVGSVAIYLTFEVFQNKYNGCKVDDYLVVERTSNLYKIIDIRKTIDGVVINFEYVMSLKKPFVVDGVLNTFYIEQQIDNKKENDGCFEAFFAFIIMVLLFFLLYLGVR